MGKNSKGGNQHVTPRGNQWTVTGEGNSRATVIVQTQREAISIAKPIATNQGGDVIIHEGIVRSANVTVTEMILILLRVNQTTTPNMAWFF